jgi:pimeloyl-ACP methyl ester carboxylesterase
MLGVAITAAASLRRILTVPSGLLALLAGALAGLLVLGLPEGAGLPVLCLAGLTRNSTDFDYLAPHLPDIRLIRLDYRGRGQSDWADPALRPPRRWRRAVRG